MLRQFILAALLAVTSTLFAQQGDIALPANMETPTEPGWFRVDPVSGKLSPLEKVHSVMDGGRYNYRIYLPGLQSTVSLPSGAQLFAIRLTTLSGKAPTLEEQRQRFQKNPERLERLLPETKGRYATKQYVPLELVNTYGDVANLTDPRGHSRATRTFLFRSQPLSPGEYAISGVGLLTPWVYGGSGPILQEAHAFTVAYRAAPQGLPGTPVAIPSSQSVQLIVPFATGGGADQIARTFIGGVGDTSLAGATVLNYPGEGGAVGKQMIAGAKPDGQILGVVSGNESNVNVARGLTAISLLIRGSGERVPAGYWVALVGPPGMDPQVVQRINRDALTALAKVRDRLAALSVTVVGSSESDLAAFIAAGGGRLPASSAPRAN